MAVSGHAPGSAVLGVTIAFTSLAAFATGLRLFTRLVIVHSAGKDDLCITVAIVFSILMTITMCAQVDNGLGRHMASLSQQELVRCLQWMWASIWIYYLALGCAKCSILLQYLRIFPHAKVRLACFIMIGIISLYTTWTAFSALFACTPVAYFWDFSLKGKCLNRLGVWFSNATINIVTDIITAILPLPVLKSLCLPKRQRIVLMVIFSLGGFTCIVSILRLSSLYAISKATDITWENPLAAIWSNMEVNIGILCSCLPTLKGCINQYLPGLLSSVISTPGVAKITTTPQHAKSRARDSNEVYAGSHIYNTSRKAAAWGELGSQEQYHKGNEIHVFTVMRQDVDLERSISV